jgi:hypothetical protein
MKIKDDLAGTIDISGSLTKTVKYISSDNENRNNNKKKEEIHSYDGFEKNMEDFHLMKIGKLVEEMENNLRNNLDTIYVGKTKEVLIYFLYRLSSLFLKLKSLYLILEIKILERERRKRAFLQVVC